MRGLARTCFAALAFGAAACGGYDPAYDCAQTLACAQSQQRSAGMTQAECEQRSQALADALSEAERQRLDDAFGRCQDKRSCDYVTCVQAR